MASVTGSGDAASSDDVGVVTSELLRALTRRGFSSSDAEEAVLEALAHLASTRGAPSADADEPVRNAGAYLFWLARNRAVDTVRRHGRVDPHADPESAGSGRSAIRLFSESDDKLVRLLDREATARSVAAAMRAADSAGDHLALRVVDTWLRRAQATGEAPTSREIAPLVHGSHTSVNQALRRFKGYIERTGRADA